MSQIQRPNPRPANVEPSASSASSARQSPSSASLSNNDGEEEEEEEEEIDLDAEIPAVQIDLPETGALSEARARKHIADLQAYGEAWREKAHELLTEIMVLKARLARGSRRGRRSKAIVTRDAPYERDTVLRFGKQWCVFGSPWLDAGAFGKYPTTSMPHPQSPAQFETAESHLQGTIVQLHEFLGDNKLRELAAESSSFRNEFIANISTECSSGMTQIRNGVSSIFCELDVNIPKELCHANCWQERANNADMKKLLQAPPNAPGSGKSPLSAVFFPRQVYNMSQCFMNEIQPKIIRCVLFGPNSLEGGSVNCASSLGNIWGVTKVNGSTIAFSAVILQFLLNSDPSLEPVSGKTKMEYCKNFMTFQKLIEVSAGSSSSWAATLFNFYNDCVFKGHKSSVSSTGDDDPGLSQAMFDLSLQPNSNPTTSTNLGVDAGIGPSTDKSHAPDVATSGTPSLTQIPADDNASLPPPVDKNTNEGAALEPAESRSPSPALPEPSDGGVQSVRGAHGGARGGARGARGGARGARGRGASHVAVSADPPEIIDSEPTEGQTKPKRSTRTKNK
ncbi:hypothetical protein AAF712_013954 [Marasmius tenuissimus]|uniref:Uncharacterized protein n=1 Tax=Marasmius tenuissimus TaxID=585030 RepID=A0ABR2ZCI6_9AGAR